jgi:hypothetical protein
VKTKVLISVLTLLICTTTLKAMAQSEMQAIEPDKLVVLWTSDDPLLAERMALMYTHAAKTAGWFSEVTLIIWGPSAKLVAENLKIQEKLLAMQKDGIVIEGCVVCSNAYGVTEELKKLGFDIKGMGKPLTDYLKSEAKVLTL